MEKAVIYKTYISMLLSKYFIRCFCFDLQFECLTMCQAQAPWQVIHRMVSTINGRGHCFSGALSLVGSLFFVLVRISHASGSTKEIPKVCWLSNKSVRLHTNSNVNIPLQQMVHATRSFRNSSKFHLMASILCS